MYRFGSLCNSVKYRLDNFQKVCDFHLYSSTAPKMEDDNADYFMDLNDDNKPTKRNEKVVSAYHNPFSIISLAIAEGELNLHC